MLVAALVVSDSLGFGFDRAARAADLPDVIVRFNPQTAGRVEQRIAALPDVAAYTVRSDGWAGPALYLAGVTVLPEARQRGIAGAISAWLLTRGTAAGARVAHLHPDSDQAARVYARLGFDEVDGFNVYVDEHYYDRDARTRI